MIMAEGASRSNIRPALSASASSSQASSSSEPCVTPSSVSSRKRTAAGNYAGLSTPKRRKPMGRPRNDWTASRRRKLIRLYLMTELNVGELGATLRSDRFQPWYVNLLKVSDIVKSLTLRQANGTSRSS